LRHLDVKPEVRQRFNQRTGPAFIAGHGIRAAAAGTGPPPASTYTFSYRHLTRAAELTDYECPR
jgi:hypothetical protein